MTSGISHQARAKRPSGPSDRSFGLTVGGVLMVAAVARMFRGEPPRSALATVAGVLLVLALLAPSVLHRPNLLWMKLGAALGHVTSQIVLALVYLVAVIPTGIYMRMRGRDPMRRAFAPTAPTYWIDRSPASDVSHWRRQF